MRPIDYSPSLKYVIPELESTGIDIEYEWPEEIKRAAQHSVSDGLVKNIEVLAELEDLMALSEHKLHDMSVPVDPETEPEVAEAIRQLSDGEASGNSISFAMYKQALEDMEAASDLSDGYRQVVVSKFDQYMSDLNGIVAGEIYRTLRLTKRAYRSFTRFLVEDAFSYLRPDDVDRFFTHGITQSQYSEMVSHETKRLNEWIRVDQEIAEIERRLAKQKTRRSDIT